MVGALPKNINVNKKTKLKSHTHIGCGFFYILVERGIYVENKNEFSR